MSIGEFLKNAIATKVARWQTDASGNVTGLVGPGGLVDHLSVPGSTPPGMDWLSDTIPAADIYSAGLVLRPTIFFDPSAINSLGYGTFRQPISTMAALARRIKGDLSGQVLGWKRGTTLGASNGLEFLDIYASQSAPFYVVPYGDAESLPKITGLVSVPAARWSLHSGAIYKVDFDDLVTDGLIGSNLVRDCYQEGVRLAAQSALANLTSAGKSFFDTTTKILYVWLYGSDVPTSQMTVSSPDTLLSIKYADVATSGGIIVAGLHGIGSRGNTFSIAASGTTAIANCGVLQFHGCKAEKSGAYASALGNDAFIIYGPSSTVLATGVKFVGNYCSDLLNNSIEISYTDGAIIEHNTAIDHCGNGIAELWASNKNAIIRYNSCFGRIDPVMVTQATPSGIWVTDYENPTADADLTGDANGGNLFAFNSVLNCHRGGSIMSGTGNKVYHNSFIGNLTGFEFGRYSASSDSGTRTMSLDYSNNVVQNNAALGTPNSGAYFYTGAAQNNQSSKQVVCTITGNNNIYLRKGDTSKGAVRITVGGVSTFYLGQAQQASYRSAVSGFDSAAYLGDANAMNNFNADGSPTSSWSVGLGTGKTGISDAGYMDINGTPYDISAPNVGAFE